MPFTQEIFALSICTRYDEINSEFDRLFGSPRFASAHFATIGFVFF
jgi:hypothetical protein